MKRSFTGFFYVERFERVDKKGEQSSTIDGKGEITTQLAGKASIQDDRFKNMVYLNKIEYII